MTDEGEVCKSQNAAFQKNVCERAVVADAPCWHNPFF